MLLHLDYYLLVHQGLLIRLDLNQNYHLNHHYLYRSQMQQFLECYLHLYRKLLRYLINHHHLNLNLNNLEHLLHLYLQGNKLEFLNQRMFHKCLIIHFHLNLLLVQHNQMLIAIRYYRLYHLHLHLSLNS